MATPYNLNTRATTLKLAAALTHKRRWAILLYLEQYSMALNVTLVKQLQFPQSEVSRHVRVLLESGLIFKERYGRNVVYRLHQPSWLKVKRMNDRDSE